MYEAAASLAGVLNGYGDKHPGLVKITYEKGCGAGPEASVKIISYPEGAQIEYITYFNYELCRAQKLDPDDHKTCNRWREAHDSQLTKVTGDYLYLARWPDGKVRRGELRFTDKDDGTTIKLTRP